MYSTGFGAMVSDFSRCRARENDNELEEKLNKENDISFLRSR